MDEDFVDILEAFLGHQVRFVIVGAYAMAVHGVPRATGDLDLWIEPTPENAARVWSSLAEFGAPLHTLDIAPEDFTRPQVVVQLGLPPRRIDLLTGASGLSFQEAWDTRVVERLGELDVPFLGRAALIRNKRASGRPRDLSDLDALGDA